MFCFASNQFLQFSSFVVIPNIEECALILACTLFIIASFSIVFIFQDTCAHALSTSRSAISLLVMVVRFNHSIFRSFIGPKDIETALGGGFGELCVFYCYHSLKFCICAGTVALPLNLCRVSVFA